MLETVGRVSARPVRTAVGFVEEPDGSLLVVAGEPDADWARNLAALPVGRVTVGEGSWDVVADALDEHEHARAIRELILRYGTPAERLGAGPSFRLRPAGEAARQ